MLGQTHRYMHLDTEGIVVVFFCCYFIHSFFSFFLKERWQGLPKTSGVQNLSSICTGPGEDIINKQSHYTD